MNEQEVYYTIALTRMTGFNFQTALRLYRELGSGQAVYEHRLDMKDVLLIRKRIANMPVTLILENADVNGDDSVDMKDVLLIRKFIARVIDAL